MTMKQQNVRILIADAASARLIDTHRLLVDGELRQIDVLHNALQASHALGSDKPGRSFDSGPGGQRHAMEPRSDPHKEQKVHFAGALAARLNADALAGQFQRLIIAAPPALLGEIRAALDKHAQEKLTHTVAKDLTHVSLQDLPAHLAAS